MVLRITRQKMGPLFEWGQGRFTPEAPLHLFGPMQEELALPDWIHWYGPAYPQALRDEWFPRATGLLTLSRHDEGRPQVVLEAMAAGLPVIASRLPAHDDIIEHGKTGMLVDSPEALHAALDWLKNPANNQAMGMAGQSWVRSTLGTWDDCAGRYLKAYQDLLRGAA
jgi:glycosyltransferase involved in cell wall biosynthesis